jgi:hypothetical protein
MYVFLNFYLSLYFVYIVTYLVNTEGTILLPLQQRVLGINGIQMKEAIR